MMLGLHQLGLYLPAFVCGLELCRHDALPAATTGESGRESKSKHTKEVECAVNAHKTIFGALAVSSMHNDCCLLSQKLP